jgi:hypothetical protein
MTSLKRAQAMPVASMPVTAHAPSVEACPPSAPSYRAATVAEQWEWVMALVTEVTTSTTVW